MRSVVLLSLVGLASACASASADLAPPVLPKPVVVITETAPADAALPIVRIELLARAAKQQEEGDKAVDDDNSRWLAGLIDELGRPNRDQVGREGVEAFARLCMHTLDAPELAVACVGLVDDAVLAAELPPRFSDRMLERACMRLGATAHAEALACE